MILLTISYVRLFVGLHDQAREPHEHWELIWRWTEDLSLCVHASFSWHGHFSLIRFWERTTDPYIEMDVFTHIAPRNNSDVKFWLFHLLVLYRDLPHCAVGRGAITCVSKLSVLKLRGKQRISLDEYSRLVVSFYQLAFDPVMKGKKSIAPK